ncbi:zinc finger protein 510-like [Copidosoma floridanum]|uniref:zinc finger protein 510-like n=1 Tax=Copidosoma floridanum TaxID=29053 RepID=UPI0006C951A8|nr:zinc finger protein 510-like [Copidosoma floridanum]
MESEHSWNCQKPYKVLTVQADTKDYELAKDKSAVKSPATKTCQEDLKKEAAEQEPETGRENSKNSKTLKNPSVKIIEDKCLEIDEDNIVASDDDDDDNFEDYTPEESKPLVKKTRKRKTRGASNATVPSNIVCTKCNKMFRCANSYKIHMRLHTGETPYICHLCGRGFCQPGSLYYHVKHVHQGIKNHACDICGRCFAMKTAMRDHRRIHTGERPFVCDSCKKTFTTKASLYTHSKIHSQEYAFSCSYCKKPFRWRQQMVSHLTTHTKEKNHVCDVCGKAFGVKNELTRHKLTHSSERPFTCSKCGLRYGQKRYLTNHMRTKHKVKATENAATNVSGVKHT